MYRQASRDRGFTLLEVMFAATMIVFAAYFLMQAVTNTTDEFSNIKDRLVANQIMQERISGLKGVSGLYPALESLTGKTGVYVACTDRHAVPTKGQDGRPLETATFDKKAGEPSGICTGSEVESQFVPDPVRPNELHVFVLLLAKDGTLISVHEQTINLERNI